MSSIERVTIKLPQGFNPAKHQRALLKLITEKYGDGFEVDTIDPAGGTATASRQAAVTEVTQNKTTDSFEVRLARGTKPSDGDKVAIKLADQYDGYEMTRFEPFLGKATLTRLTEDEARCRGAVAVALGVKPWEVQVKSSSDGGFDLQLPRTYVPSKHDDKLDEVASQVVGRDGWYVSANAQRLTARIIPSEPPTFPGVLTYPFKKPVPKFSLKNADWAKIPLGMKLPEPGQTKGPEFYLDLLAGAHAQVGGISGGGKTVLINDYIAGCLARGAELVVVDLPSKSVDFLWCKPFCRPGGWGCDNLAAAVTSLALVMEEGERRAKVLAKHNVVKWTDLPESMSDQFRPIVVVVDELTGLFFPEKVPKLPKDHPLVIEANEINLQKALLEKYIKRIAAELRFVGVHLLISSQVASVATGIDPAMRTNLHHKVLMGSKPTENNRRLVLSDPQRVPKVPGNVASDPAAGRGTGAAEPEGQEPCVFKSFFAATGEMESWLRSRGVSETKDPAPTPSQIARHTPTLDEYTDSGSGGRQQGGGDRSPVSGRSLAEIGREMGDPNVGWDRDENGQRLTGFERANAARHAVANPGKATGKQRREAAEESEWAARSGDVTVRTGGPDRDDW
ncbi:hypothetical protein [Nocardioides pakistanensis]